MNRIIERHHDYQLSLPSVPPGGLFNVPLQLDSDAPFALRRVKSRNLNANGFRFRNPRDNYQSTQLRTDLVDNGTGTRFQNLGILIYPEYVYPQNGSIIVDIGNATNTPLVNVRLLFRGSKLYPEGQYPAPSYPRRMSGLPFIYPVVVANIPVTGSSQAVPGLNTSATLNNILNIQSDADFVARYLAADPFPASLSTPNQNFPPQQFTELYALLMDESRKPYSNEPIHVNDLFGQGNPLSANNAPNVFFPGLLTPEIYLQKEAALYFDVYRDDSALINQFPVSVHFRFHGAKVFDR